MMHSKRKCTKHAFAIFFALSFLLLLASCEVATSKNSYQFSVLDQTKAFYVNDFSGIFSSEQKEEMMQKAIELDQSYGGIQVVVTTVNSLADCVIDPSAPSNPSIEQVSYAMFKQYGIGLDDMGILILFSSGDRKVRIETGYQMQVYITDSKSGQLIDNNGLEYFKNDQFAEGLVLLQDAVISEIKTVVPQDWKGNISKELEEAEAPQESIPVISEETKSETGINAGEIAGICSFVALLVGFIASIKALISSKRKQEKLAKEADKRYQKQEEDFERRLQSTESRYQEKLQAQKSSYQEQMSQQRQMVASKEERIADQQDTIAKLQQQIAGLESKILVLQDKFSRAQKLHPEADFETEIQEMIENEFREEAKELDLKLSKVAVLPADKDRVQEFQDAISIWKGARPEVQKYVTTELANLQALHHESICLMEEYQRAEQEKRDRKSAKQAYEKILAKSQGIQDGSHENYKILKDIVGEYNALNSAAQKFFPDLYLIKRLQQFFVEAKADHEDFERAKQAEADARKIVDRIYSATENDRDRLKQALRFYTTLNYAEQRYFSSELLQKIKQKIRDVDDDHRRKERRRREEEEERHRRMMNHSSSSSFSSFGGGFSGHGGGTSGGGATRGF